MSSYPYRAARFYVGRKASRRRLWIRYHSAPGVLAGYVLAASVIAMVALIATAELCRVLHVGLRHILQSTVVGLH